MEILGQNINKFFLQFFVIKPQDRVSKNPDLQHYTLRLERGIFFIILFNTASSAATLIPVSEDARIEPRTVSTLTLAAIRSNRSARHQSHPQSKISSL